MIRNDKKILSLQNQNLKPVMYIYTSSGKLINQFQWDKGRIINIGWTNTEHLICVLEYGGVRVYDIHGEFVQFSLGQDAKDCGVIDCQIWEGGLVALTANFKLVAVTDWEEPRPNVIADKALSQAPHCWTIIPPQFTLSRHLEILLGVNNTILVADATSVQDQLLQQGPFSRMSVSPNGKFLALFTADGRLWVVSSDFQKNLAEFSTNSDTAPLQMTWCGTDSVVLHWEDTILMVGPFGDWIKYSYEGVVHLVPEFDGVRIISNDRCEFLQRVPTVTEEVFKIGSTAPGAILYDAFDHFERGSPRADENIRNIKTELTEAVDTCIEAAAHEVHPQRQRSLLKVGIYLNLPLMSIKAASFGKSFLESYNADKYVNMCQTIRVLNAVRHYEVGIPLTYTQYVRLTADVLINRLVNRNHHLLALRMCEYLKINRDRVLIHWACAKIKRSLEDEDTLCRIIVDKLGGDSAGMSYTEIAKAAYEAGQTKLATKLLDYEPQPANQVPLLMSMKEDELALTKAIESGDTDLVYLVMLHMKRQLPTAEFFRIINGKPLACSLLESYCKQQDSQLLRDFYYQDDRRVESANVAIIEGYGLNVGIQRAVLIGSEFLGGSSCLCVNAFMQDLAGRTAKLKVALKLYSDDKERAFETKATDDQIKLLQLQAVLERETAHAFTDLSISETIFKLLLLGHANRAAKVKSDFKVPDKRFWWLKVKALIQSHNWEALEKFAKSNQKFGFVGIVDTLIRAGALSQAQKYVEMMVRAGGQQEKEAQPYLELLTRSGTGGTPSRSASISSQGAAA
ncbi:hypothetical protein HK104_009629 [Borealophlyctis nickersoniae]|nr:hypothetical protein HK104_009629 [Borealophlyctis nickersoniae]